MLLNWYALWKRKLFSPSVFLSPQFKVYKKVVKFSFIPSKIFLMFSLFFGFSLSNELNISYRIATVSKKLYFSYVEGESQNLRLINCHFTTLSSHFFGIAMCIFHKTEMQTVILRCWTGLYLNWFYSYGIKC